MPTMLKWLLLKPSTNAEPLVGFKCQLLNFSSAAARYINTVQLLDRSLLVTN
jgi:hypothetical protein